VKDLSYIIISCKNHRGSNCLDPSFPVVQGAVNRILLSERKVSLAAFNVENEALSGRNGMYFSEEVCSKELGA